MKFITIFSVLVASLSVSAMPLGNPGGIDGLDIRAAKPVASSIPLAKLLGTGGAKKPLVPKPGKKPAAPTAAKP
ncbi:hypothetical protein FB45DRAFT_1025653 [Roridomyces roridus]|uniref:Uncharacterized protein n=1 Tax=Roridomyces roridus TaxID=1738132 RepID=A0AAD7C0P7_9AGAR|nr:hypothetical protein FB45DRAFT_1025653 [Roridomyces roridus]